MQTCDPRLITRPDVFAYGRAIPEVAGWYDYRICYRQSATERLRTLQALSWSWRPYSCAMRPIDGAAFDAWLGKRTLLFLGDSLNAQMYYSLSWLLGDSIAEHKDLFGYETPGANRTERKMDTCTTGVGNEGGWLSTATLRGGGRLVKVMRHGDLIDEMKRMEKAFWAPWLQEADIVVLNVGHHYHSKDPTFGKYPRLVRTTMNQLGKLIKPSAQLIYRTTNVGHHKCENASRPLRSRLAAWEKLTETGTSVWEWNTRKSARRPEPPASPDRPRSLVPASLITTAAGSIQLRNGTAALAPPPATRRAAAAFIPSIPLRRVGGRPLQRQVQLAGAADVRGGVGGGGGARARPVGRALHRAQRVVHGRARRRPRGGEPAVLVDARPLRRRLEAQLPARLPALLLPRAVRLLGEDAVQPAHEQRQVRGRIKP